MLTNAHELFPSHLHLYLPISPQTFPHQNLNQQNTEESCNRVNVYAYLYTKVTYNNIYFGYKVTIYIYIYILYI